MRDVEAELNRLAIAFIRHDHPAVFTVEEADRHTGHLPGGRTKNLFLRNKNGKRHYLVVAESDRPVDLAAMRKALGESSLSFASPERLRTHLGLTPGSVSPFGILNDAAHAVVVIVDEGLLRHAALNFHPNINTATLTLATEDFRRFLAESGNEVRYQELPG